MKKTQVVCWILILALALCGCEAELMEHSVLGGNAETVKTKEKPKLTDISVLYYPDMDTNPVTTTCLANSEVLKLVYSPLVRIGSNFKPYCVLADSFETEGNKVTVKIKDVKFSNGQPVTAKDVVKSFNTAKWNYLSPYYSSASAMSKYYAEDDKTFVCVFAKADTDCASLLDIPIMYNGTAGVGCGPYVLSEQNGKRILSENVEYFKKPKIPVIYLTETKKDEYITSMFSAGELDILTSAVSDDSSLSSLRDYSIFSYPSNTMLYIGVNASFGDSTKRTALSRCIDRSRIAKQDLGNLADPCEIPFNPNWYRLTAEDTALTYTAKDAGESAKLLADTELTLLVPDTGDSKLAVASAIAEQFKSLGLTLTVVTEPKDRYLADVQSGNFVMYIGETAVARDMDPTFIYSQGGSLNYTGVFDARLDEQFAQYKSGQTEIKDYAGSFKAEMPIIPLAFRRNTVFCAKGIDNFSAQSPWSVFGDFSTVTAE